MKKLLLGIFVFLLMFSSPANAYQVYDDDDTTSSHYDAGMQYLQSYQYTSAIQEFKKAMREKPDDLSSKIGLTNAYISRAAYYNNQAHDYQRAANDLRSALFYMKYYDDSAVDYSMTQATNAAEQNLATVLTVMKVDRSLKGRYTSAKQLRMQGEFAASGYEFYQLIDTQYQKEAYVCIGDVMKILGSKLRAAAFYEKAVQQDPNNADLHLKLARAYEDIGNSEGAANEYNKALENSNEKEDILLSLEKIWADKVAKYPNDADAHSNLAVVYQKENKFNEAMTEYQKAQTLNPTNTNTKLNLGTLYQSQNNYPAAIAVYDSIIQLYPNHVESHLYKGQCLKALGQNEAAVKEYNMAITYAPNNKEAKEELFDLLKQTMPADQVLSYMSQSTGKPMDAQTCYNFAYDLHKANKLDDAIVYYKESMKLNPENIDTYINLSQVYRQKKDINSAIAIINQGKAKFPQNVDLQKQYRSIMAEVSSGLYADATKLFEQGQFNAAIQAYQKIQPPTAESQLGIAASYQALENYNMALDYYKKALALDPTNSDIPYYMGSVYLNLDQFTNARIYLNKSLALDKTNEKTKSLLKFATEQENNELLDKALDLYDQKKYFDALKIVNGVISKSPNSGAAYYYRGLIYDAQKHYQLAVTDYQKAVTYSKDFSLAYYSLGVDLDTLGRHQEAISAYRKYLAAKPEENEFTQYARKRVAQGK
ncbi:MAG: tetratricopeptide repeat protein [Candidatus Gastranaerophilales bacterium]|nr:tetratricopeptide repeat protein [Candidatus Gastranaerophilales bacterium]